MTCEHCANAIDTALGRVDGVLDASTSYASGQARVVTKQSVSADALTEAVRATGYRVLRVESADAPGEAAGRSDAEVDLAIVGSGSAGVAAAIRAAEAGARVVVVEAGTLGGTCVNVGCVPSKTLIRAAEAHHRASHVAFAGLAPRAGSIEWDRLVAQKDELVGELRQAKYADVLASYPSISVVRGRAAFRRDGALEVDGSIVRARKILVATGASPWAPPIPGLADTPYLTSTSALALEALPPSMIVLGASAVGLELAQMFARVGTQVTLLEALPRIAPAEDEAVSAALAGYLREEGLRVRAGVDVRRVSSVPAGVQVEIADGDDVGVLSAASLLVATGRRPNTAGMGLEEAGIRLGPKGEVVVDEHLRTARPNVYAAGDVIGDPAFVYVAAYAGSLAADNALNGDGRRYDLSVVPRVTFTDPAIASIGLTEAQARAQIANVRVSTLPMSYVPRAIAARDTRGLIKLIADASSNLLVGAHILAPEAGDLINQAALAMRFGIRVDEIASMLYPYLTNAEGLKLAAQTFEKDVAKLSCCAA